MAVACALATLCGAPVALANTGPIAVDDELPGASTTDPSGVGIILANDQDEDGDPLEGVIETQPAHGSVAYSPVAGELVLTPEEGFVGVDSFTYRASDGQALSDVATVTVGFGVFAPLLGDVSFTTPPGSTRVVPGDLMRSLVRDRDGEPVPDATIEYLSAPANGTLVTDGDGFEYTPDDGFEGEDSFTARAFDGTFHSNVATITIVVGDPPGAPVAEDDDLVAYQHAPLTASLVANDDDPDGDALRPEFVVTPDCCASIGPDGTFAFFSADTGSFSFIYRAVETDDPDSYSGPATATVTVLPNALPVAVDDELETPFETALVFPVSLLLENDSDPDGDAIREAYVAFDTDHGTMEFIPAVNGYRYTPDDGFSGVDSFSYGVADVHGAVSDGTARITVGPQDTTAPTVTIDQAPLLEQPDPAATAPILFDVVFSEAVDDFATGDVLLSGTAGATTATVSSVGLERTHYRVEISGMTTAGTVIASIPLAAAHDAAGNPSAASTSTDAVVTYAPTPPDGTPPTVTIDQAAGQADPTNSLPIRFDVVFSEVVTGFAAADVSFTGSSSGPSGATIAPVVGEPTRYAVSVPTTASNGTVVASIPASRVQDAAGNPNTASTSTDASVTLDRVRPTVTIAPQGTSPFAVTTGPIRYTVQFGKPVTGFAADDVTFRGFAAVPGVAVTNVVPTAGDASRYVVEVTGMTRDGQLIADVRDRAAEDALGNESVASPNSSNVAVWDAAGAPTVVVTTLRPVMAPDPTSQANFGFRLEFSEPVTRLHRPGDVIATGTACPSGACRAQQGGAQGGETILIDQAPGGPPILDGTVIVDYAAGAALDAAGNPSLASTADDNTITLDRIAPTVTLEQASDQPDPTDQREIAWVATFSENVTGVDRFDIRVEPSSVVALASDTPTVTGSGREYRFTARIRPEVNAATVTASLIAAAGRDAALNSSLASTSADASVTFGPPLPPSVTIGQRSDQPDPTLTGPILFDVAFSAPVTGFDGSDVVLTGGAGASTAAVSGSGRLYTVEVSGMTRDGTVTAALPAGAAQTPAGAQSLASTSTDATVTFVVRPTVTITRPPGAGASTDAASVPFLVIFSEPVFGFDADDVSITGTAGASGVTVSPIAGGEDTDYAVSVAGMSANGTVSPAMAADRVLDAQGYGNLASAGDPTVEFIGFPTVGIHQLPGSPDPAVSATIPFEVVFSLPVTGFGPEDVALTGTAGATTATVVATGDPAVYRVEVGGMPRNGTVTAAIVAGAALGPTGFGSLASADTGAPGSDDDTVTFNGFPTVDVFQLPGSPDPTGASTIPFEVAFSLPVTGFGPEDVALGGTAGATTASVVATADPAVYRVQASGMTANGTVTAAIVAGGAVGPSGLGNLASADTGAPGSDDDTVTWNGAAAPGVTIGDAAQDELDADRRPMTFTLRRSGPTVGARATVAWRTSPDTATAGSDYVSKTGTVTFARNMTTATVNVAVVGDEVLEPDEAFRILLTSSTGTPISDAEAIGTITNDD